MWKIIVRGDSMKKNLLLIIIFLLLILLISCDNDIQYESNEPSIHLEEDESTVTLYDVIIEDHNYVLEQYEPKNGSYLGAYVLADQTLDFKISAYENLMEKKHALYTRHMKLGETLSENWLLECIANQKTPHIILYPPNDTMPYQKHLLELNIKQFSNYFIPMFVEFYPNPAEFKGNCNDYVAFYQEAYRLFKRYAPNVALVWSISDEHLAESNLYFPGKYYVDWIGLNMYIQSDELKNIYKIQQTITKFHTQYQYLKPLMISQLAVSHYTDKEHRYYIQEAVDVFHMIYKNIREKYNRIKCINYVNFNNIETAPPGEGENNYKITEQEGILNAYKEGIQTNYFLEDIEYTGDKEVWDTEKFALQCNIYETAGKYYIEQVIDEYVPLDETMKQKTIDGKVYYSIDDFQLIPDIRFMVDEKRRKILIEKGLKD